MSDQKDKVLKFKDAIIFYNLVFDIGSNTNPIEMARKLSEQNFVRNFVNYKTGEVELPNRHKKLISLSEKAKDLSEIYSILENQKLKGLLKWSLKHPLKAIKLKLFMNRTKKENNKTNDENDIDIENLHDELNNFINTSMYNDQYFKRLQYQCDMKIFSPIYLKEIPFVRIGLQPFHANINGEKNSIDVDLLIHRTGVAILTFYMVYKEKNTDEIIDLQISNNLKIDEFKVEETIGNYVDGTPDSKEKSSGVNWCKFKDKQDIDLEYIFQIYRTRCLSRKLSHLVKNFYKYYSCRSSFRSSVG